MRSRRSSRSGPPALPGAVESTARLQRVLKRLRLLDDRAVPRAADRVQRSVTTLRARLDVTQAALPVAARIVRRGGQRQWLDRLDARFAALPPWQLWRARPLLSGLAVVALLLSGISVAAFRPQPHNCAASAVAGTGQDFARVGPQVGDKVRPYIASRARELHIRALNCPAQVAYAVVNLSSYRRPEDLVGVVGLAKPVRVLFRVPLPHAVTEVSQAPVSDIVVDTLHAFETSAGLQARYATTFRTLFKQFPQTAKDQTKYLELYNELAATFEAQVRALRSGCACVFAIVVIAPLRQLDALQHAEGIRLVDVAPPTLSISQLRFWGLLPEQRVTVDNSGINSVVGGRL